MSANGRRHRLVRVLVRTHAGDQEWDEVDALLDRPGVAWDATSGPRARSDEGGWSTTGAMPRATP